MEDSEEILLHSLSSSGVPIPDGISSVQDLSPETLFSICSCALRLIDWTHYPASFPASLPEESMPDRIKICSELAAAFNNLGFKPNLSFHKFLYPSKEDLYKLVRFLVGKISEYQTAASRNENNTAKKELGDEGETAQIEEIPARIKDQELNTQAIESSNVKSQDKLDQKDAGCNSVLSEESTVAENDLGLNRCTLADHSLEGVESFVKNAFRNQDGSQVPDEIGMFRAAAEMIFGGEHTVEYYNEQLSDKVEVKRQKLKKMEFEWDTIEKSLLEQKINLEQSLSLLNPGLSGKLARLKEMELEIKYLTAEIKTRDEELFKLSLDLEKQPKQQAPRRSYIERINEITKNSRKQDNDIQRILKDTRELQLESNTIQERLNRTYAVVNETIFREAKKDEVARQAYRLLTDIHESFEQIAEKILAADRSRRDAADYEAKLAIIGARSFNVDKLQEDLDATRKENDLLEQRLQNL